MLLRQSLAKTQKSSLRMATVFLKTLYFNFCRPHSALYQKATETTPAVQQNTSNGPRLDEPRLEGRGVF
jgi:hypothetical protein